MPLTAAKACLHMPSKQLLRQLALTGDVGCKSRNLQNECAVNWVLDVLLTCVRRWFSGKSDVWRLCQDLAECMDGRVWPAKDRDLVRAFPGAPGLHS